MLCIIVLLLITIAIWLLYSKYQSNNLPPGPVNLPVIGALYVFADKSRQPHEVLTDLSKKYGGIFGLQMGSLYTVVLSDPTLIREAFKRDEYAGRAPLYLTHGIMEGKGKIWGVRIAFVLFGNFFVRRIAFIYGLLTRKPFGARIFNAEGHAEEDTKELDRKTTRNPDKKIKKEEIDGIPSSGSWQQQQHV